MEALLQQLSSLVDSGIDQKARQATLDALKKAQHALETPWDIAQRFAGIHLEITAARIGVNLGVFRILTTSEEPITVEQLSKPKPEGTGAPNEMLARILRHLAATGLIKETAKDTYSANVVTQTLAGDGYEAGVKHFFDNIGPVFQELPAFLENTEYAEITDPTNTPFNKAFATKLPFFMWMPMEAPDRFENLQKTMTVVQAGAKPWFTVFPFEERAGNIEESTSPIFVDVGGSKGHQCVALLQAYPQLAGRVYLQDLEQTFAYVPDLPGIEKQVQDFFTPNQVKGSKFYYLRAVFHDHPDDKALVILKHLKDAMGPESEILIDEMIVPNEGAHWQATQIDLTMMAILAARERTEEQWRKLIDDAGLKIKSISTYISPKQDSIIACVPK